MSLSLRTASEALTLDRFLALTPDSSALHSFYNDLSSKLLSCLSPSGSNSLLYASSLSSIEQRLSHLETIDPSRQLPLHGVPYTLKDNVDKAGTPTSCACPGYTYAASEDSVIAHVLDALGAVFVGKTNMDQFATGLVGTRSPGGTVPNWFNEKYIGGGSSSGAARSVVEGIAVIAIGTDTAGSGRVPAVMQGIVGIKPSRDIIPTNGVVPACKSIDCVAIFTQLIEDGQSVYELIVKFLVQEGTSPRADELLDNLDKTTSIKSLRIGIPKQDDLLFMGNDNGKTKNSFELAVQTMATSTEVNANVIDIDYSMLASAASLLYGDALVGERYAAVGRDVERLKHDKNSGLDDTVAGIILSAKTWKGWQVFDAMDKLKTLRLKAQKEIWRNIDVIMVPSTPGVPTIDEVAKDPIDKNSLMGTYTNFVNLLDLCAIAVPCTSEENGEGKSDDGVPRGVTIIAPALDDWKVMALAKVMHRALDN